MSNLFCYLACSRFFNKKIHLQTAMRLDCIYDGLRILSFWDHTFCRHFSRLRRIVTELYSKACLFWLQLQQFAFVKSRKERNNTKNIFCTKFQNLVSILNGSSHFEQVPTKLSFVKRILHTTFKSLIIEKWLTEFASTFTPHLKVATKSPYICHLRHHKRLMQKWLTERDQDRTCLLTPL